MDVCNKTRRPLRVPLPGGRKVHIGPGKTAQISPKAADHPPLKKLIEAGELEIQGGGRHGTDLGTSNTGPSPSTGHAQGGGIRHTGDR